MRAIPLSQCPICSEIPWVSRADSAWALPPATRRLGGMEKVSSGTRGAADLRCPECGACYEYQAYGEECDPEVVLQRLRPTQAKKILSPAEYDRQIGAAAADLSCANPELRWSAAQTMAEHHLAREDADEVRRLLRSSDRRVLSGAVRALYELVERGQSLAPYWLVLAERFLEGDEDTRAGVSLVRHGIAALGQGFVDAVARGPLDFVVLAILWDARNAKMDIGALAPRRAELEQWLRDFEKQEPGGCALGRVKDARRYVSDLVGESPSGPSSG